MTFNAKSRLIADKATAQRHLDNVASDVFQRSAEAALVDMVMTMPDVTDLPSAAAAYNRVVGARDFLRSLMSIAEPPTPAKPQPNYGLSKPA